MPPISKAALILLLLAAGLAFWRGGTWEKRISIALLLGWLVSTLQPFDLVHLPWPAVIADVGVFLFLLYACLRSAPKWVIAAAAFQFLVLASHYAFATNRDLMQWAYVSAYYVWNIALTAALLFGTLSRRRGPAMGARWWNRNANVDPRTRSRPD